MLALRGRIRETPWYSFFTWGWKEPLSWWQSFRYDGKDYQAPTAMIDLAKPAFKLGVAKLRVGLAAHELQVSVSADKPQYLIREKARRQGARHAGRQAAWPAPRSPSPPSTKACSRCAATTRGSCSTR